MVRALKATTRTSVWYSVIEPRRAKYGRAFYIVINAKHTV